VPHTPLASRSNGLRGKGLRIACMYRFMAGVRTRRPAPGIRDVLAGNMI
jgi:hypothetical protein